MVFQEYRVRTERETDRRAINPLSALFSRYSHKKSPQPRDTFFDF